MISGSAEQNYSAPFGIVKPKLRRFIVWFVISLHTAIVVLPGLYFSFIAWLKPKEILVSKVVLVDSLPNDNKIPSRNPGPSPIPNNDIASPPSLPDLPELPKEEPVPQPQPKPEPKPQPKPQPKSQPKTKTTPVEKPQPKPKQQKKILTSEDIRKNIRKSGKTTKTNTKPTAANTSSALSKLAGEIRADAKAPGGAGGPMGKYDPNADKEREYQLIIGNFLKYKWTNRPDAAALGGRRPVVEVWLQIAPDGRVLRWKIVKKCGIATVDSSIQALLRTVTRVPRPPSGKTTEVPGFMRVEDD